MFCDGQGSEHEPSRRGSLLSADRRLTLPHGSSPEETAERILKELNFWESHEKTTPHHRGRRRESRRESDATEEMANQPRLPLRMEDTEWRKAFDPNSGRTYYFSALTRETQWEKPAEVKAMERRAKAEKRRRDRLFFNEMEKNVCKSLARGERIPGIALDSPDILKPTVQPESTKETPFPGPEARVRTISNMDEVMLAELSGGNVKVTTTKTTVTTTTTTTVVPARDLSGRPPLPVSRRLLHVENNGDASLDLSPEDTSRLEAREDTAELVGERLLDDPIEDEVGLELEGSSMQKSHIRRNTGGTIFVKSTMTNPDVTATLKCVCGVFRAHIVQASGKRGGGSPVSSMANPHVDMKAVFLDPNWRYEKPRVPSLEDVVAFYTDFYKRSQMEHDTIIMSLIYIERLIKESNITPGAENWKSVLLSCMVLASKVWDDLSMWNVDFSKVCGRGCGEGLESFTLARINQLELALLKSLGFNVKVPASEYAKYYFLIRNMLMKSGLLDESHEEEERHKPLDMAGAKNLKTLSANYHEAAKSADRLGAPSARRSKSLSDYDFVSPEHEREVPKPRVVPALQQSVCLEQLVSMNR